VANIQRLLEDIRTRSRLAAVGRERGEKRLDRQKTARQEKNLGRESQVLNKEKESPA